MATLSFCIIVVLRFFKAHLQVPRTNDIWGTRIQVLYMIDMHPAALYCHKLLSLESTTWTILIKPTELLIGPLVSLRAFSLRGHSKCTGGLVREPQERESERSLTDLSGAQNQLSTSIIILNKSMIPHKSQVPHLSNQKAAGLEY